MREMAIGREGSNEGPATTATKRTTRSSTFSASVHLSQKTRFKILDGLNADLEVHFEE